jgi:hypothetical protein
MVTKYLRRRQYSIDTDYRYYLGREGLFGIVFGHHLKPKQLRKANYIWKSLLAQEGREAYLSKPRRKK